ERGVVGLLGEDAELHEPLADRTRRAVELDAGPQSASARIADEVALEPAEPLVQVRAELAGTLLVLAGLHHRDDLAADRAGERVAPERRTVLAGLEDAEHVGVRDDRRDRH